MSNRKAKQARQEAQKEETQYLHWEQVNGLWFATLFTDNEVQGAKSQADLHLVALEVVSHEAALASDFGLMWDVITRAAVTLPGFLTPSRLSAEEQKVWDALPAREHRDYKLFLSFAVAEEMTARRLAGHDCDTPIMDVVKFRIGRVA